MTIAEKAEALLEAISRRDVAAMRPAVRRRLAAACRRVAELCDADEQRRPRSGVLAELQDGRQA